MALCGKSEGPNECLPEVKPPEQSEQGIDCDEFDAIKHIVFLQGFPWRCPLWGNYSVWWRRPRAFAGWDWDDQCEGLERQHHLQELPTLRHGLPRVSPGTLKSFFSRWFSGSGALSFPLGTRWDTGCFSLSPAHQGFPWMAFRWVQSKEINLHGGSFEMQFYPGALWIKRTTEVLHWTRR